MALDVPEDYATVLHSIALTGMSRRMAVTYGIEFGSFGGTPDELAQSVQDVFWPEIGGQMDIDFELEETIVRANIGAPDPYTSIATGPGGGALSNSTPPVNVAVLVKKITSSGGRRNRGRMFLPGVVSEGAVSESGIISSGAVAALQGACTSFLDLLVTNGTPMYVLHNDPPVGVDPAPVIVLQVDNVVATQRRRLRG